MDNGRPIVRLPEKIRERIKLFWRKNPQHAAKQAYCYFLDFYKVFGRDQNQVVDVGLSTGMLAQKMHRRSADAFIEAFEVQILTGMA